MSPNRGNSGTLPITSLKYRDLAGSLRDVGTHGEPHHEEADEVAAKFLSEDVLKKRVQEERLAAVQETERRLAIELEQKIQAARAPIAAAVVQFQEQRNEYFAKVESEVVQLALAIARKILHREAQVDPMLVAALVRIAVEKLREGSSVTIHVHPRRVASWSQYFAAQVSAVRVEVEEDPALSELDCIVETELGTANFGLDTQLKEVEQGFFDLLALRPDKQ